MSASHSDQSHHRDNGVTEAPTAYPPSHDVQQWSHILLTTLDDAIELLQITVFEDGWDVARANAEDHEAAFRDLLRTYEYGLADLLRFIRACGLPASAVGWSQLKAELRRKAVEAGDEPTLRTGLESGLYVAEQTELGDHVRYQQWATHLMQFVASRTDGVAPLPPQADEETRLRWAVAVLGALEEHAAFHAAFAAWCAEGDTNGDAAAARATSSTHDAALLAFARYDLVLNTALRWLAGL